jgi:hypothetical protein
VFWKSKFFLLKEFVDKVGEAIELARVRGDKEKVGKKKGKQKEKQTVGEEQLKETAKGDRVPDAAVDDCERSHKAGSGSTVKTYMELFDDTGVMALVCRHDIPLVAANIDTPGEQQKYAVALIQHLFSLILENATVTVLYDVGCVLNRSQEKVRTYARSHGTH